MKRSQLSSLALLVLVLAGCQSKSDDSAAQATVEVGPKYSPKSGLYVPNDTRHSLGLRTVEVTEQAIATTIELPLQVYRSNGTASLASGPVTSEQAKLLKNGLAVRVLADDGRKLQGRILSISDQLQRAMRTSEVLVEIPHAGEGPAFGGFLSAIIEINSDKSVVTIPRAALLESSDGHSVYTVSGNSFVRTPVKVGVINGNYAEIKDGLYAGDQVVQEPVMSLWMTELAAVKGGQACCVVPAKGK